MLLINLYFGMAILVYGILIGHEKEFTFSQFIGALFWPIVVGTAIYLEYKKEQNVN